VSPQSSGTSDPEQPDGAAPEPRTPREELAESTAHGQVYLQRLQRAQLGLSITSLMAFAAIFGVMPLALYLLPHLDRITLLSVPLPLWIIVVPMLPVFVAIGWLYARRADEIDDAFRDLVQR
jgi:putative solute:sodium symporter small subunit